MKNGERLKREHREPEKGLWRVPFRKVFEMDLRSLALFRIMVGLTLLLDLASRFQVVREMYSGEGFLPRELSRTAYNLLAGTDIAHAVWSVHWLNDSVEFQTCVFAFAALTAVALTLGWKTRIVTIASWILLVSMHVRNPLILSAGDFFLKLSLFWSMFLPLGAVWSIDARKRAKPATMKLASFVTAAFILQLIVMYFFTGLAKLNEVWFSGDAMYYVLRLDIYITDFGRQLLANPTLLKWVSWATLLVEVVLIFGLLSPRFNSFFRWINLFTYWAFHIGISMAMNIGLFPIICMVGWLPLIPGSFWDRFSANSKSLESTEGQEDAEAPATNCQPVPLDQSRWVNGFAAVVMTIVILWNIFNIKTPVIQSVAKATGWYSIGTLVYFAKIDQHFQMFGVPPKKTPWFVYDATLKNGTQIDILRNQPVDHERPESVLKSIDGHYWRKLHRNLVAGEYAALRQPLTDFFVKDWNQQHGPEEQIVRLRLICYLEDIGPDYNSTNRSSTVWGSYVNEEESGGSVFDKFKKQMEDGGDPTMPF